MLNLVDRLILRLLDTGWTTTPPPVKPSFFFSVPDGDWLTRVRARTGVQLNIYMYEVRENREFRRASWDNVTLADGTVVLSHPPAYLDLHYLISAWSSTIDSDVTSPVLDEHQVLSEALRVLLRNPDVVPSAIGIPNGGVVFQNAHVYLNVAPPEPPRVLNDFWSTMKLPWRPAVMLVVTAPLDLLQDSPPSPVLTTLIQRFAQIGTATVEELIDIGGLVLRAADQSPIPEALVERLDSGETATTDAQGRYVFTGISRGVHRFRASAAGMTPIERDIDVPADPPATHVFQLSP
ncbi:MAG TPA: Pvc16 family protein [Pyrinomonadaceae bacterium]|nr:Pvc16 family protein [Pyrinomonadaceae bacterium]